MPDPTETNCNPPMSNKVTIYRLLVGGEYPSKIAKRLGVSHVLVLKYAKKYVAEGLLERTNIYPALFRVKKSIVTPPFATNPIVTPPLAPHRFGATFAIVGKPRVVRRKAFFTVKEHEYTLQIGTEKAILWLHFLAGTTPQEQIDWGRARALRLAEGFAARYGCGFNLLRVLPDIEWTLTDKGASQELADKTGIRKDKPIEVAAAMFRFDDPSHPRLIEINKAMGKPPEIPTAHAQTLYFLLTAAPALMEKQINLTTSITESIVVLNQKIEVLAELIRKGKP